MKQLRLKVITCESLSREMFLAAAFSDHIIDFKFFPRTAHEEPEGMQRLLQEEIDCSSSPALRDGSCQKGVICPACCDTAYDHIVIGIGLCGNAVAGITAGTTPLVVPKMHDCNAFLLGSARRFKEFMAEDPGTVFYLLGQVERSAELSDVDGLPRSTGLGRKLSEYIEKYGEDNAKYLMEIEHSWTASHNRAAYLFPELGTTLSHSIRQKVRAYTDQFGWELIALKQETEFFQRLLGADWDADTFLIVEPGMTVLPTHDDEVLTCQ
ncbi:MAG: DUF1638 domain-containing protein [Kiritimatiellia bacterium]|nr:DUF1638 domain-containing protein [Kiritimatiellia bacterium]MDP6809849.1 DUF1638 domain-containing protein [Kiritimatiellia bacterium]MDP7024241.1 DUF1638 domain-containing protein [Kiritimatiellia bacterium]